jgi:hypothetical protein
MPFDRVIDLHLKIRLLVNQRQHFTLCMHQLANVVHVDDPTSIQHFIGLQRIQYQQFDATIDALTQQVNQLQAARRQYIDFTNKYSQPSNPRLLDQRWWPVINSFEEIGTAGIDFNPARLVFWMTAVVSDDVKDMIAAAFDAQPHEIEWHNPLCDCISC